MKKNDRTPWQQQQWGRPPTANAAGVWAMADILAGSPRPYDPQRPVGGLEAARQPLVAETRGPMPAAPGKLARIEDEDERHGMAPLCMVFEPLAGPRRVRVTDRHPAIDVAPGRRAVVDVPSPQADPLVLVLDTLPTHTPAALSAAFEPAEARRLWARLERHHTP